MRRPPLLATLIVAAACAVMVGLGIWQLRRAEWKDRVIAELTAAEAAPVLDLDPLLRDPGGPDVPTAFRRALVTCTNEGEEPLLRAGRSLSGATGYGYYIHCRPGAAGWPARLLVNTGWAPSPSAARRLSLSGTIAGRIGAVDEGEPVILTAATPLPGLEASAAPSVEDIPNNHLAYAVQWFVFAFTAALIYLLAVVRRPSARRP